MNMKNSWYIKGALRVLAMFGLATYIVMILWNWLMPELFQLTSITYLQALGILVLSKILFKSGSGLSGGWGGQICKKQMKEKWSEMTPEQREKFRTKWESRCNKWSVGSEDCDK
jgi:hypothetical protein